MERYGMSLWIGDYQFEEEFNDDRAFSNNFGRMAAGTLGSSSDIDWFGVDLPGNTTINIKFESTNYQPGIWNVSWFSPGMQGLSEQNISLSGRDGVSSYEYSITSGPSGGTHFYRVKSFAPNFFKSDVYFVTLDAPTTGTPVISAQPNEVSVSEGDTENPVAPVTIALDTPSSGSVVVHYAVRSGTANVGTAIGADVIGSLSGTLTLAPGQTSVSLSNTFIWSDTAAEGNEYFWVDFDRIVLGDALFEGGAQSLSVKVNILDDDFDNTPPTLTSFFPQDSASAVPIDTNLVVGFSEDIQRGSGSIVLRTATGETVETFNAASSPRLTFSGSTLTINPSADFKYSTAYLVSFGAGSVRDLTGNAYAGSSSYDFSTMSKPGRTFTGTSGDDVLTGTDGADSFEGQAGRDTVVFAGPISDYTITINRAAQYATVSDRVPGRDGTDALRNIETMQFAGQNFEIFTPAEAGPAEKPSYGGTNAFLFDAPYYLMSNPELVPATTLATAVSHYFSIGASRGLKPNAWFDAGYYENRWPDLKPLGLDDATLFMHYNLYGVWEGRSAGPFFDRFDGNRYLRDNPDVAAYVDAYISDFLGSRTNGALAHYVIYGANEGRPVYDMSGTLLDPSITIP
jgi:hypothetical protein